MKLAEKLTPYTAHGPSTCPNCGDWRATIFIRGLGDLICKRCADAAQKVDAVETAPAPPLR